MIEDGHTRNGDRLPMILVLGLSCANCSLRCDGKLLSHAFSSSFSDPIFWIDKSSECDAGYSSSSTLARIRLPRKSAKALASLVDSPGRVGWKPRSETFSSSMSTGYSV